MDFTRISKHYAEQALVQQSAGDLLMSLLEIKDKELILDLGCGPGHITKLLAAKSGTLIKGIDPSDGMIEKAKEAYQTATITFEVGKAETLDDRNQYDLIFCNSAMQWFDESSTALKNCYKALRPGGRIGVQAPATANYSPNFLKAIGEINQDEYIRNVFNSFKNPWWFLESASAYSNVFKKVGFKIDLSEIRVTKSKHSVEDVFKIFESGAMAGYLNPGYYTQKWPTDYETRFQVAVKAAFKKQADENNEVELTFKRIILIATKPSEG